MTCKEKFIKDHPDYSKEKMDLVFSGECPSDYDIMNDPCDAAGNMACHTITCIDCWDREIPETEETSESGGPRKVRDEHAFELANKNARIAELEQRNKNQSDL